MNKSMDSMNNSMVSLNGGQHKATLKGKINGLDEVMRNIQDEIAVQKREITTLRSEKETLDDTITRKCKDIRRELTEEVLKADEDLKQKSSSQKNENQKMQTQINTLKSEKLNLQQHLLELQRRCMELEQCVGNEVAESKINITQ